MIKHILNNKLIILNNDIRIQNKNKLNYKIHLYFIINKQLINLINFIKFSKDYIIFYIHKLLSILYKSQNKNVGKIYPNKLKVLFNKFKK